MSLSTTGTGVETRCLKITGKVSFNIASKSSYVYILSGQKFIKNARKWSILASSGKPEACGETVLPARSLFNRTEIGGKCLNSKIQMRHFDEFSNNVGLK